MLLNETRTLTTSVSQQQQQQSKMNPSFKRSRDQAAMRIRSRYLHRLGVCDSSSASSSASLDDSFSVTSTDLSIGSPERKHMRRRSRSNEIEFLSLKGSEPSVPSKSNHKAKSPSVSFEDFVVVHPIPNIDAYTEEMKSAIWTNSEQMEQEVMRNYLEFASEGMNWQDTLEEEDFFEYNNELIHPVHILNRHCSLQQNFLLGMRARQACQWMLLFDNEHTHEASFMASYYTFTSMIQTIGVL